MQTIQRNLVPEFPEKSILCRSRAAGNLVCLQGFDSHMGHWWLVARLVGGVSVWCYANVNYNNEPDSLSARSSWKRPEHLIADDASNLNWIISNWLDFIVLKIFDSIKKIWHVDMRDFQSSRYNELSHWLKKIPVPFQWFIRREL